MARRRAPVIFLMERSSFSLKIERACCLPAAAAAMPPDPRDDTRRCSSVPARERLAPPRRGRALRFRSQRCLRERIEQLNCGAGDAEDLAAATTQGDPGFERSDTFGAQAFDQRLRQVVWQCMRHAGQSSQFASFAKRELTLISRQLLNQRWTSQNGAAAAEARPAIIPGTSHHSFRGVRPRRRRTRRLPLRCCSSARKPGPALGYHEHPCRCASRRRHSPTR